MSDVHHDEFVAAGLDEDALDAAINLIGRTGATAFEIGYLHDDVPTTEAGWYAHAQYKGARLIAENRRGPIEAAEGLARRILNGAECTHCHCVITLSGKATTSGVCRWTRLGARWERGCATPAESEATR